MKNFTIKCETKFYILTTILLCGIAIHYMFITLLLHDNFCLKLWKEIVIAILFTDTIIFIASSKKNKFNINFSDWAFLIFGISLIIAGFLTKNLYKFFFVARIYILPILIYYIAKNNNKLTKQLINRVMRVVLYFYTTISLWGIFQALILGDKFLIKLGYPLKYADRLKDSYYFSGFGNFQRVVSTFANTNVFGAVIGILIIIIVLNPILISDFKFKKSCLFVLIFAFILTFSRSNWLAMSLIILISFFKDKNIIKNNKKLVKDILIFLFLFIMIILLYNQISNINIFEIVKKYIINTITLKDTSSAGRFGIWKLAFITFINNPFGIGLGHVGMVSTKLTGNMMIACESSYFAILLDTGIQGALFYFLALFNTFYIRKSNYENNVKNYLTTIRCITIYLLIMFLFSNHIYDLEIMITAFFFIGLGSNKEFLKTLN